ncbi:probable LRR receptor-like serine/threonine-protein kinase At1g06840 isoform X2 [Alnus glutinosa]|uniref:probable LRR receptor-like serine/threonine-protein kinase At1g06840 isoform X2 n=1 Tax=Alnus glutinosa TaxID=3517 RepID=UPI002D789850|nr:probable LRR receptor-like serine/threonine-protein kinase At1g06840 isoform X2 [Alnus glutinosa]
MLMYHPSRAWTYGLLIVACLSWSSLLIGAQSSTDPLEVTALRAIKASLINPKNLGNWDRGDPCTSNWTGVVCYSAIFSYDGYLHVDRLQLLRMNLSGILSPELGQLLNMRILDFRWNQISGNIPKEIGNIQSLVHLFLNGNQLTGPLPEELGYLPNLVRIHIDENSISGPIPTSFSNLNRAKHFYMNNNSISGQIPPELSRLRNLFHFLLDNNNLSGYLPPNFSELPNLRILQLDNNNFDGASIPPSYSNMSNLLKLSLRNCNLRGPIPDFSQIPNLYYLDLSSNQLNGSIPPNRLAENVTTIYLSNNKLEGPVPSNFSSLPRLQRLSIANNSLNGSIPSTIWQNKNLTSNESLIVELQNNKLSNVTGTTNLPQNVSVWLRGNPLCSNSNLLQFCESESDYDYKSQGSINVTFNCSDCPPSFEYSPTSPIPCLCAAPLLVRYRLKSPGFTDFRPYKDVFEQYLTSALGLFPYQLYLDSFTWEKGPRLGMFLKLFPDYSKNSFLFNQSEVQRVMSKFTSWGIVDSDLFGPYELLDFTLSDVYKEAVDEIISVESLQFNFATIRVATENFSDANKLGQGGFGVVYKGMLSDGQEIAVKRLSSVSRQGDQEFKNEVLLMAKIQHRNLIRLLGFCLEGNERLLIYELMPNASLDQFLFDPIKRLHLDWERRYKIIFGIARGLLYLHEDSQFRIIHRDLKTSNILLDSKMNPKIADFGMARLFVLDQTDGNTSRIVGTYGYMAPEYAMHGHFSIKSDVFSFGVLVLEMVSGQKNSYFLIGENFENLLSHAWRNWTEGTASNLIDPTLRASSTSEIMRCIHIGLLCVQENVVDRPTMASIVHMLDGHPITLSVPSWPAFFRHTIVESNMSSNQSFQVSTNEASISELCPR